MNLPDTAGTTKTKKTTATSLDTAELMHRRVVAVADMSTPAPASSASTPRPRPVDLTPAEISRRHFSPAPLEKNCTTVMWLVAENTEHACTSVSASVPQVDRDLSYDSITTRVPPFPPSQMHRRDVASRQEYRARLPRRKSASAEPCHHISEPSYIDCRARTTASFRCITLRTPVSLSKPVRQPKEAVAQRS